MTAPLLRTKLYIAPPHATLVPRPRLIARLHAGLERKLTLVSAPAGFGKTTLLSSWLHQLADQESRPPAPPPPRPSARVAWLSLDESDNDLTRFLTYLIAALRTVQEDVGVAALSLLQSPQPPSVEAILSTLINEMALITQGDHGGRPCVLVLDDYHRVTARPVHEVLTFLLEHLPPRMHLAIAGRADPPLPLARLRARAQLTELRAADLRFSPAEAAAFLNDVMGLGLSTEDVAALDARTEGWIAGLQMAALSMRGRTDMTGFIEAFSGSHRFVLDYLVEEVLDQQPPYIQDFLLKTSILERMIAPLCDVILIRPSAPLSPVSPAPPPPSPSAPAQDVLAYLERNNLFVVPLDDERRWYRYHHLFADLLRSRLELMHPDIAPALHRRASEWYEQNGLIAEAVSHALAAGDVKRMARLIAGNALPMIYHGELKTLVGWLDALPDELVRSQPWLCVAYGWTLAYAGTFDAVEPLLQEAEKALVGLDEDIEGPVLSEAEGQRIVGHIAAIRAYNAALSGEIARATYLAREALEHLPKEDLKVRGSIATTLGSMLQVGGDLVAASQVLTEASDISKAADDRHLTIEILGDLAVLQITQGQLHKAGATCRDALQLADEYLRQRGRPLSVAACAYICIGAVLREWNDLEAAMHRAMEGLALSRQWGQASVSLQGYVEVARVLQARGDMDGALNAIQEAKLVAAGVSSWCRALMASQEARLCLAQGNLGAASRWAQESELSVHDEFGFQYLSGYIVLARVLIAQEAFDEALRLLARLLDLTETAGAMGRAIEILVLQAIALQAQDTFDQALVPLERALSLAEPEGYVRTFIDEGAPMGKLLRRAAARGISFDYVGTLLATLESDARARGAQVDLIEPLSARELEVLRVLATGLSNKEIAEILFIAVGTVKQHLKSIYGKLHVHSRTEAAHRARDLGLL